MTLAAVAVSVLLGITLAASFKLPSMSVGSFNVTSAVKKVPNVFNLAKYLPDVGQERLAQGVVKNLITTFLLTPSGVIPDEIELPDVDMKIPNIGQVVMEQGKILGLLTYVQYPLETAKEENGNMEVIIGLHFEDLRVIYNKINFKPWGFKLEKYAKLVLKFNSNLLISKISVVKYFEVFDKVMKNECTCFLTSLNITDLSDVKVEFSINGLQSNGLHNMLLSNGMWYLQDAVTHQVNYAIIKYTYTTLPASGSWLCKDDRLYQYVQDVDQREADAKQLAKQKKQQTWLRTVTNLLKI